MLKEVIAIFDIGKTNKKFLLFDAGLSLVHQEEGIFPETLDEEGFSCDDAVLLETWMWKALSAAISSG